MKPICEQIVISNQRGLEHIRGLLSGLVSSQVNRELPQRVWEQVRGEVWLKVYRHLKDEIQ